MTLSILITVLATVLIIEVIEWVFIRHARKTGKPNFVTRYNDWSVRSATNFVAHLIDKLEKRSKTKNEAVRDDEPEA